MPRNFNAVVSMTSFLNDLLAGLVTFKPRCNLLP